MKIPCKSIFLTLLLLAGLTSAYAEPGRGRGPRQDQGQQSYEAERNGERAMQRNEREQNRESANAHAPSRNNGRMTQEERSALRRQINEAGQDIYSGKYKR